MEGETLKRNYVDRLRGRKRKVVLNILENVLKNINVTNSVKEASEATSCSKQTIYALRKELQQHGTVTTPAKRTYLRELKRFRGLGKPIICTDESWLNVGLSVQKEWKDTTVKSARHQLFKA
ncbi:hypothetical protein PR048_006500 [Dryococelus australis]|uniref:Transposase n=1 Tax=Dryococelus australis TaxID=614101 RepID=A0ABQ9IB49_9NEOP|nr:hypothetical protein PR048_006500 [Dryococelus australis]